MEVDPGYNRVAEPTVAVHEVRLRDDLDYHHQD